MVYNIVVAGVGGQGTVLATRAIGQAALMQNYAVRTSETIGMAQREGSVSGHVRFGEEVAGPQIPDGTADVLLGFELAEAARSLHKLKPDGVAIISTETVIPASVSIGKSEYDAGAIKEYLQSVKQRVILLDAKKLAGLAGNPKTANAVLLGALSVLAGFPLPEEVLLAGIMKSLPPKVHAVNTKAFKIGQQSMEG